VAGVLELYLLVEACKRLLEALELVGKEMLAGLDKLPQ
jgi:hypothetical protein